jgi:hypothetical protein
MRSELRAAARPALAVALALAGAAVVGCERSRVEDSAVDRFPRAA